MSLSDNAVATLFVEVLKVTEQVSDKVWSRGPTL